MNGENINKSDSRPRVLVAPLDWGLGHAARCIPIIHTISPHAEVFLAGEGAVVRILQEAFPQLPVLALPGYRVGYSRTKKNFTLKLLIQLPKIAGAIRKENKWLGEMVEQYHFDVVISDNRFGLYHPATTCIYISHQLQIQTGFPFLDHLVQKWHYSYINRFWECWVPDNAGKENLAGNLSHPAVMPRCPVHYIGLLSRLKLTIATAQYDYILLVSGPEPQRSLFEAILLKLFNNSAYSFLLVRGLPGHSTLPPTSDNGTAVNHLPAPELAQAIQQSNMVIARSGYSTMMDLVTLKKKALLVPTPGQTEQEYLASYAKTKNYFCYLAQQDLTMDNIIEVSKGFQPGFDLPTALQEGPILAALGKQATHNAKD